MRYVYSKNKVICLADYRGKTIKGVATCHPSDTYDKKYGEKLAKLKCLEKLRWKQLKDAYNKLEYIGKQISFFEEEENKANLVYEDLLIKHAKAHANLYDTLETYIK